MTSADYFEILGIPSDSSIDDIKKAYRSKQRARTYAQASYIRFKKTSFYRTTRIFDATTIIFSLLISVAVLIYTIFGYFYRIHHPIPGVENPTIVAFVGLLLLGMLFFVISFVFLKAHIESSKKHKRKSTGPA